MLALIEWRGSWRNMNNGWELNCVAALICMQKQLDELEKWEYVWMFFKKLNKTQWKMRKIFYGLNGWPEASMSTADMSWKAYACLENCEKDTKYNLRSKILYFKPTIPRSLHKLSSGGHSTCVHRTESRCHVWQRIKQT